MGSMNKGIEEREEEEARLGGRVREGRLQWDWKKRKTWRCQIPRSWLWKKRLRAQKEGMEPSGTQWPKRTVINSGGREMLDGEQEEMDNVVSDLGAMKPTEIPLAISKSWLPKRPMFLNRRERFPFLFSITGRKQTRFVNLKIPKLYTYTPPIVLWKKHKKTLYDDG